jgi:hypothetical protein
MLIVLPRLGWWGCSNTTHYRHSLRHIVQAESMLEMSTMKLKVGAKGGVLTHTLSHPTYSNLSQHRHRRVIPTQVGTHDVALWEL